MVSLSIPITDWWAGSHKIKKQQIEVEQAAENLRISQDNYKAGVIGISDLLEAQSVYQSALDNLTEAKCNNQIKMARYLQAAGVINR